jgi:hypothetical protein
VSGLRHWTVPHRPTKDRLIPDFQGTAGEAVEGQTRMSLPLQSDTQSAEPADHRQSAIEALAAENRELRARVADLVARLAERS